MPRAIPTTLGEQVAAHDAQIGALANDLRSLAETVGTGFGAIRADIANMAKANQESISAMTSASQTNWGTLAAWAGIAILLGGGLFAYIDKSRDVDRVRIELNENHAVEIRTLMFNDVKEHLGRIDAILQKERGLSGDIGTNTLLR